MYNSMYVKLPDPLSRMWRLKGVACETRSLSMLGSNSGSQQPFVRNSLHSNYIIGCGRIKFFLH